MRLTSRNRRTRPDAVIPILLTVVATLSAGRAQGEEAGPVAAQATTGYELALNGVVTTELGDELRLQGVAFEVDGLATLRAKRGLRIDAAVTARRRAAPGREQVTQRSVTSAAEGRFEIAIELPERALVTPQLELTVHRPGEPGRTFTFGLQSRLPHQLDLLLDRRRYEPGETVHTWVRMTSVRGRAPAAGAAIELTLIDYRGQPAGEQTISTTAAGVANFEIELPESAGNGQWRVRAVVTDGGVANPAEGSFNVTRRTVERLQATLEIDQELVEPGGALSGRVRVTDPSGSAVRGATVELRPSSGEALILQTDAEGIATFRTNAPAFLSGDVGSQTLVARVVHGAHGTITAAATYTVARVRWMVEATPGAGALVPEVDSELFFDVSDPRGRPIAEGTRLRIRGAGLPNGRAEATTDARGLALVTVELPLGAYSQRRSGDCAGSVATTFEVEVMSSPPITARLCVAVADEALLVPRSERALVEPGGVVNVTVDRRPAVARRPVLVEALWSGRAVAWARIDGGRSQATIDLPNDLQGLIELRARPIYPADRSQPLDEPGATLLGRGASTAILVRPADAFSLEVEPARELWRIQERATVDLETSTPPQRGWAALLVRDQAAHGGEGPWDLDWLRGQLQEAASAAGEPENDRFLRLALAASVSPDGEPAAPPPLVTPPWATSRHTGSYAMSMARRLGVLRDPVARREELLRRGLAPITRALENAVTRLGSNTKARTGIVQARGNRISFHPDVVANLVAARNINDLQARTLGGEPLTLALLRRADPSFSFDTVARRVARARLVRLLQGLLRLADPDDPNAARASAGEPPERWLSRLVQLGMIEAEALVDPWGRPFVFRRVTGGRDPAVIVSERALDYELVSPGPDGVAGTGDDVRDPFERIVPQGTPYAVSSGEDQLMEQLSRIAPGNRVLQSMVQAFNRVGLAAQEEQRRGPIEAAGSEDMGVVADGLFEAQMAAEAEAPSGGAGYGRGMGGLADGARRERASAEMPMPSVAAATPAPDEVAPAPPPADRAQADEMDNRAGVMSTLIREEFPATLFFVGEVPIDDQGHASVEVPLADALTTYRLEAIAWTASGWTVSAMSRLRVDQEAMVDAPVPPFATTGDRLRLPVRIANRTNDAIPARIEVEAEGDLSLDAPETIEVEIPARDAIESIIEVRPSAVGEGTLLIRAVRADNGRGLDAVRRPLTVLADVRLVREDREVLVEAGESIRIQVPQQASPRGPGQLRVAVGGDLFGDPEVWGGSGSSSDALWAGWALAVAGRELPEEQLTRLLAQLPNSSDEFYFDPQQAALLLALLWTDDRFSDELAAAALRSVSQNLPAELDGAVGEPPPGFADQAVWLLTGLAPVLRHMDQRPELRADLERIATQLRRAISSAAAAASEAPVVWAAAAASLALYEPGQENSRALEMLRRAQRSVIEVGDEAWLEPNTTDGTVLPRIEPTALLAIAHLETGGDRDRALALLRSLIRVVRGVDQWPTRARALASAAAALLTGGDVELEQLRVTLDGRTVEASVEEGLLIADLDGLGTPGDHVIEIALPRGQLALTWIQARYGLPWSVTPAREAPVSLRWNGPAGVRDGRAGLALEVSNRGARIITRPIVEIELPAGTELDEPTRQAFAERLTAPASVDGRTMRLQLRPLAPGGYVRIPMPLRWALSGTIIGLGTTFWDDASPASLAARPVRILPSEGIEIADRGDEPEPAEADSSPPPLEPRPRPLPHLEPLAAEVQR